MIFDADWTKDAAADAESLDGLPLDDPRVVKSRKRIARKAQRKAARRQRRGGPLVRLAVLNFPLHMLQMLRGVGRAAVFTLGATAWWGAAAWCWAVALPVMVGGG